MGVRNRQSRRLVVCLAVGALLAACGRVSSGVGQTNTLSPAPTVGVSSTAVVSGGLPTSAPVRPVKAVGLSLAAGAAFIGYYVELLNYGYATGDTVPLLGEGDKGCEGCRGIADYSRKINVKNGGLEGDYADHLVAVKEIYQGEGGRLGGSAAVKAGTYVERSSPGASPVPQASGTGTMQFTLSPSGGNWAMYEMEIKEDEAG